MSRLGSTVDTGHRRAFIAVVTVLVMLAACTPAGPANLLTDPHEIMTKAIHSTAALSSVRIHADMAVSTRGLGGAGGDVRATLDADVDVARRLLAGRMTTQIPAGLGGGQAGQDAQISEFITLPNASFTRSGGVGRWTKFSTGGIGAPVGPTNEQVAGIAEQLLAQPGVKLDRGESAACSLGTCYHVTATVDGLTAFQAISAVLGQPQANPGNVVIPALVFDLLIDQATGVLSEVRVQTTIQGTSFQLAALFTNPDVAVQIVAPPPAIVDDINANGGFDGAGSGTATPQPVPMESSEPGTPESLSP